MPRLTALAVVSIALLGTGCTSGFGASSPPDPGVAGFTECPPPHVFSGETTLAALGLGELVGPQDAVRPGQIWITREGADGQVICVDWGDSGLTANLTEQFMPPESTSDDSASGPPIAMVALLLAAVVGVVSYLAFRAERRSAD